MKKKLIVTLFVVLQVSLIAQAGIGYTYNDIYYWLNDNNKTAEVGPLVNGKYQGDVSIPPTVDYNGDTFTVTSIGQNAFSYCSGLTSVSIPSSVSLIDNYAFQGCNSLTSVTIPNSVTSIGSYAFYKCSGLTSVTIPNSVTSIDYCAFEGCSGLTTVTIPNSVTSIGNAVFSRCSSLTSVNIPIGVTEIKVSTFAYCTSLETLTIPNSVTSIGDSAFEGCSSLISMSIPNSVTSIGNSAFKDCCCLLSVFLGNGVTTIGENAFYNCSALTSVTIPKSVTLIDRYAFSGCYGLESILVEKGNTYYDSRNNCNAIIETATGNLIMGCNNTIIPDGITSIGDFAFYKCKELTSVTIPNTVTRIGDSAFSDCIGLTSITIPNSVISIEYGAFWSCTGLTSLIIPNSVTKIGQFAFAGCDKLTEITCWAKTPPSAYKSFGNLVLYKIKLFVPYKSLQAYRSSDGWKSFNKNYPIDIRLNSFYYYLDNQKREAIITDYENDIDGDLEIPSSVVYNYNGTNYNVVAVYDQAFENCGSITSVTLPESITSIGKAAFSGCNSLTKITCFAEIPPSTYNDVFNSVTISTVTLYVPEHSLSLYKSISPWSEIGTILPIEDGITTQINTPITSFSTSRSPIYTISGHRMSGKPTQKGVYIHEGKKVVY